ncbi:MAG: response regulator transcription factor [Lachnospiraceae bacterium]|nr:response regulator transcription factor [Lachnospiraceae bacterium]
MNYKIAICDDRKEDIEYISSIVKDWASGKGHSVTIKDFQSAEEFLFHYDDESDYDILLLDIEMGAMNGVELARRVRRQNREIQIIFITGYNDYIADGYDVEALNYILKPVHADKLMAVLDRACEKLKKNEAALIFDLPGGMVRIPLYEIRYIEVRANYVTIHATEEISVKTTLSGIEKKLDEGFFKTGRSYIVNMHYIRKVTKTEVVLKGEIVIPLSRGLYEPLNRAFIKFF